MWVRVAHMDGDGELSIAGVGTRRVVAGVVDWPDHLRAPKGWTETLPPEEAVKEARARKREEVRALAAELGLTVVEDGDAATAPEAEGTDVSRSRRKR
jgi:hypothetical protein